MDDVRPSSAQHHANRVFESSLRPDTPPTARKPAFVSGGAGRRSTSAGASATSPLRGGPRDPSLDPKPLRPTLRSVNRRSLEKQLGWISDSSGDEPVGNHRGRRRIVADPDEAKETAQRQQEEEEERKEDHVEPPGKPTAPVLPGPEPSPEPATLPAPAPAQQPLVARDFFRSSAPAAEGTDQVHVRVSDRVEVTVLVGSGREQQQQAQEQQAPPLPPPVQQQTQQQQAPPPPPPPPQQQQPEAPSSQSQPRVSRAAATSPVRVPDPAPNGSLPFLPVLFPVNLAAMAPPVEEPHAERHESPAEQFRLPGGAGRSSSSGRGRQQQPRSRSVLRELRQRLETDRREDVREACCAAVVTRREPVSSRLLRTFGSCSSLLPPQDINQARLDERQRIQQLSFTELVEYLHPSDTPLPQPQGLKLPAPLGFATAPFPPGASSQAPRPLVRPVLPAFLPVTHWPCPPVANPGPRSVLLPVQLQGYSPPAPAPLNHRSPAPRGTPAEESGDLWRAHRAAILSRQDRAQAPARSPCRTCHHHPCTCAFCRACQRDPCACANNSRGATASGAFSARVGGRAASAIDDLRRLAEFLERSNVEKDLLLQEAAEVLQASRAGTAAPPG